MREQPWHERRISATHEIHYQALSELHQLTLQWLDTLNKERPEHGLPRGASGIRSPEIRQSLWMLEGLAQHPTDPSPLLDDTSPDDLMGRLEITVRTVQAWVLTQLFQESGKSAHAELRNQLEQASWKQGRETGLKRWQGFQPPLLEDFRESVPKLMSATTDAWARPGSFLIRRRTRDHVTAHWTTCSHVLFKDPQYMILALEPAILNELCSLHVHWMRGYGYALNTRIRIDQDHQDPCQLRWALLG